MPKKKVSSVAHWSDQDLDILLAVLKGKAEGKKLKSHIV